MLSTVRALSCPQCAAPLPRVARWRSVTCSYCSATIVHGTPTVSRDTFRAALQRVQGLPPAGPELLWQGGRYQGVQRLGTGAFSEVFLARRLGPAAERLTFKLAREAGAAAAFQREVEVLQALQSLQVPGAAYFGRRLPQAVGRGPALFSDRAEPAREALVLRHPAGHWGSLADVRQAHGSGIDPRHAVWLWRRMLEVLAYVHDNGWVHGDIAPDHALVQPADHGVLLIGWGRAHRPDARSAARAQAQDLMQSAWVVRALLHGGHPGDVACGPHTPEPLAALLRQASEDAVAAARLGARGIEQALSAAARAAFGAPQFVHFNPAPHGA